MRRKLHDPKVASGNRQVFRTSIFGAALLLAAAAAHTPATPRQPGVLVATELLQTVPATTLLECAADESPGSLELRFERITTDPDPDEMRRLMSRGAQRIVAFEWDSESGELSYGASAPFTLPAIRRGVTWPHSLTSCESR